jgi:hypothetical protein
MVHVPLAYERSGIGRDISPTPAFHTQSPIIVKNPPFSAGSVFLVIRYAEVASVLAVCNCEFSSLSNRAGCEGMVQHRMRDRFCL